jgi:hypothetical protein
VVENAHDTPVLQVRPDAPQKVESIISAELAATGNDSTGTSVFTGVVALLWIWKNLVAAFLL